MTFVDVDNALTTEDWGAHNATARDLPNRCEVCERPCGCGGSGILFGATPRELQSIGIANPPEGKRRLLAMKVCCSCIATPVPLYLRILKKLAARRAAVN